MAPKPASQTLNFHKGEYIFNEGDHSDSLFLVKSGSVAIRKTKANGEIEIAKIFSNEILGELSFFDRHPRSASAVALTDVTAMEISFEGLDKIFEVVPPYFKTIMAAVAERLRKADEIIRRLERDFVHDEASAKSGLEEFSASDALASLDKPRKDGGEV